MRTHKLRRFKWIALVVAFGLSIPALVAFAGEAPAVDQILAIGRDSSQVMEHLDVLCNRIGPRLTSSDDLQNACEWARDRFKSFGIENARLEEWGTFPVGFNRGPWRGRMVEPTEKSLEFGTNAWTAGTKGVTKGSAVLAPENDEQLSAAKPNLKGAWVLVPRAAGGGRGGFGAQPPADPEARKKQEAEAEFRKKRDAVFAEQGIAGVVRPANGELIVTSGNHRISWDTLPTTPTIDLVQKQWTEIASLLKDGKPVVLEFDVRNYFKKGPIKLYNVIADIPGTERPDEYVIVGGHIDSWDGATGATDNGTGCATALEAARILMKTGVKPKRTIRFMLWSGEEQGLLGSRAYVESHKDLMPKISAVLVHDGGTNYLSGISATEAMMSDMEQIFKPVIGLDPVLPFALRKVEGLRAGGGSDHASFFAAGVPAFFWGQAGKAVYRNTHHTQHDTYNMAIPEYQRHSSVVIALASFGIADLDHLLSRDKMVAPAGQGGGRRRPEAAKDETPKKDESKKEEVKKDPATS
jgi:carboxypeptidase Q